MKTDSQAIARPPAISSLGLICAAQFVLQLDFSIVNVALPTIQRELGFTPADLQWVVTGYALTFGSLLLLVVPKTHRLAGEAHVPLSEVAHEAVVIDKVGSGLRESGTSKAGISSRQFAYLAVPTHLRSIGSYTMGGAERKKERNKA